MIDGFDRRGDVLPYGLGVKRAEITAVLFDVCGGFSGGLAHGTTVARYAV